MGFCFILLKRGRADFACGPVTRVLAAGDSVVLKQAIAASFRSTASTGFTIFHFSFLPENLDGLITIGERWIMEASRGMGKDCAAYYPVNSEFARLFAALVERYPTPGSLAHACHLLPLVATLLGGLGFGKNHELRSGIFEVFFSIWHFASNFYIMDLAFPGSWNNRRLLFADDG